MSQPTEREDGIDFDTDVALERIRDLYHIPVVAALLVFMLWNRVRTWERFVTNDGQVLFRGNDPWYHLRETQWTVNHFPWTMPFDPWTGFPEGTSVGQFGTLFDQIAAFAALVVGLGNPTSHEVAMTMLFYPAVLGTLVAVPVYFIGRRISGRAGGVLAVLIVALSPGAILTRSVVGAADHQIAEALFMAIALVGVMVALGVAREERPVWELFRAREWDALRRPLAYGAFAGFTLGLYMWVWPPAIMMVGLLALYCFLELSIEYVRGEAPEHTAIVMAAAMVVAALMALVKFETFDLTVTKFSLVQPLIALLTGAGVLVMAAVAREWTSRGYDRRLYPVPFLVVGAVVAGLMAVAVPDVFGYVVGQVERVFGLGATATAQTVGEATPLSFNSQSPYYWVDEVQKSYGLLFYTGLVGGLLVLARVVLEDRPYPEAFLVAFWCGAMTLATFTQNRFDYYLILPIAALNGYLASFVFSWVNLDELDEVTDVSAYQVIVVATILLLVVGSFVTFVPATGGTAAAQADGTQATTTTAQGSTGPSLELRTLAAAGENGPGEAQAWRPGLTWMRNNTPNPETADFQYYGTFEPTDDYQYSEEQYGVLSWWDYGHYITHIGRRIPVANPFQQNARHAADVLLARNESEALDRMSHGNGEETRYVVLDQQLANPGSLKYTAPTAFDSIGVETSDVAFVMWQQSGNQVQPVRRLPTQGHYESLRVRLYQYHGSSITPQGQGGRVYVLDWDVLRLQDGSTVRTFPQDGSQPVKRFNTTAEARQFVQQDGSAQVGGIGGSSGAYVPALRHFRLVHASSNSGYTKVFERVPGATIEGQGPANSNLTVRVPMLIPGQGPQGLFYYTQRVQTGPDGRFSTTVPYSTTGYENYGPENGHTNVSVTAASPYQVYTTQGNTTYLANATVTEGQVIGENASATQVTLTEWEGGNQSTGSGGSSSDGNASGGNGSTENGSGQNSTGGNGSGALAEPVVAPSVDRPAMATGLTG